MKRTAICLCLVLAGCSTSSPRPSSSPTPSPSVAQKPSPSQVQLVPQLTEIGTFDRPIFLTAPAGDPRLFIVERAGRIQIMKNGMKLQRPFLDMSRQVSSDGERGLFSIAFAPDYRSSGLVYVDYTDRKGNSHVDEFHVEPSDPDRIDPSTQRSVLAVDQPYPNHNGGMLLFDLQGMLLIGFGDGGSAGDPQNRAQNKGELLGKILRIDPRHRTAGAPYAIPQDNPFTGQAATSGVRPEIWTYGMRNPWRFSFDADGNLWVADVGQDKTEEVDRVKPSDQAGANFGWPAYEGDHRYSGEKIDESHLVRPVFVYGHDDGCSVTGGHVYRGSVTALRGIYLFNDFCNGRIRGLSSEGAEPQLTELKAEDVVSFGEDSSHEMYVVSLSGPIYKITGKAA